MKKSTNSQDMLTWLAHTVKMAAVSLFFTFLINATAGFIIATMVIFLREKDQSNNIYEFWRWKKWDSIADWVIPVAWLTVQYWIFTVMYVGYWS
ncbi:MAG: hypothetical protein L3J79_06615 [Candidatus Marinimicrobia bacterium]|nr:hypothetical protein [Candidatus Neomarinimicrobiota bacterium]